MTAGLGLPPSLQCVADEISPASVLLALWGWRDIMALKDIADCLI
jgi:hypothetical protein